MVFYRQQKKIKIGISNWIIEINSKIGIKLVDARFDFNLSSLCDPKKHIVCQYGAEQVSFTLIELFTYGKAAKSNFVEIWSMALKHSWYPNVTKLGLK